MTVAVIPWPNTPPPQVSLQSVIPMYLYQEYSDDAALQAFASVANLMLQQYVDWFNQINLPLYTQPQISGPLLDFVGSGLYGLPRPTLPYGSSVNRGPLNTWVLNSIAFNAQKAISSGGVYVTTDDIYRRILTWHLYLGDGKVFNIKWLKRRIMRFLYGVDGTDYIVDQTYPVSVSFATGNVVNITFSGPAPVSAILGAAIASGAVELPAQYNYNVTAS